VTRLATSPARPPGPPGHFLVGNLPEFARDILGFFSTCTREYGDIVHMRLAGNDVFLLENPRDIETVLLTERNNFIKHTFFFRHVTAIFGNGLLTSEGDFWLRQRRLAAPAFHPDRIASYGSVMAAFARRTADRWRPWEVRDVYRDLMRLTMEIVSKTLFDAEVAEEIAEIERSFDRIVRQIAKRFRRPFRIPDLVPTPGNLLYRRGVARLDRLVAKILEERRTRPGDRGDLLSMLLAARDDDGQPMSDQQVRDEVITLFLAGHETTAITLAWALDLLARHPEVDRRASQEITERLGERLPTAADLLRLPYVEAVVKETLRLCPPAYVIGREPLADCTLGGYPVPARSTVYFAPWVLHRDPRWWNEPDNFRPERWLDGSIATLPKYVYLPFGGGPRVCIGERFAMMETVLVLATLLPRFRFETAGPAPRPFPSITLRPDRPVLMRLVARSSPASLASRVPRSESRVF